MLRHSASRSFQNWNYVTSSWHRALGRRLASSGKVTSTPQAESGVPYEHTLKGSSSDKDAALPSSADVVVIGGGAVGCSTLYHLSKLGVNAVLVEKDQLTAGTTWHTAGLLWQFRTSDTEIELINYSRNLIKSLEDETGVNPGWIENGGMFIASNKIRMDEYRRLMTLGKLLDIESYALSPTETKELYPLMNVSDVYGTLYVPGDGTLEPAGYCTALTRGATKNGAKVFTETIVEGISTKDDEFGAKRVQKVHTSRGTISCDVVVNCGGCWAPQIGEMVGVDVPLVPMKHAYVVTERIEGIQNTPNVRDHDASLYLRLQGDAISLGGYEAHPEILEKVDRNFAFSLFDLDYDVFGVHIEGAINRVPAIENVGIKSTVCGPESFTADHKALLGESPDVRGFYLGCGFNSAGMMMSGGWGRELALWVKNGKPQVDMFAVDIRRFHKSLTKNRTWNLERSHEAYAKNYSIVFAHDQPLAGRNQIKGALHQSLLDAGCVYEERQGWERPGWFSDSPAKILPYDYYGSYGHTVNENNVYKQRIEQDYTFDFPEHHSLIGEEVRACRENVVIIDMSYFGKFFLTGPDALKTVNYLFSNDMQKGIGSTVYTCMCNDNGGVEADLTVSTINPGNGEAHAPKFTGPGFYIAAGGAISNHVHTHMRNVIQDEKFRCNILDNSEKMSILSIQGPKSRELLEELSKEDLSNENFPFSANKVISVAGVELLAMRISFVGELGWELHTPNEGAVQVYNALMEMGEKLGIKNCGYRAMDSMSVEKGYRHWHGDLRSTDTPLEAGLAFTCKLKTPIPFKGREAIERQKAEGIKKRLVCLTTDKPLCLTGFETLWRNGALVGYVRQGDFGFTLDKTVGWAYVKGPNGQKVTLDYIKEGKYEIELMGEKYPVEVHTKSIFDPENKRVKGFY